MFRSLAQDEFPRADPATLQDSERSGGGGCSEEVAGKEDNNDDESSPPTLSQLSRRSSSNADDNDSGNGADGSNHTHDGSVAGSSVTNSRSESGSNNISAINNSTRNLNASLMAINTNLHTDEQPLEQPLEQPRRRKSSVTSSIRDAIENSVSRRIIRNSPKKRDGDRLAELDDEEGKSEFFLILLIESLDDELPWFLGNTLILTIWSVLCALFSSWLRDRTLQNPGGTEEVWLLDIENCRSAISILGTLFVFTLVFRFNSCYDRWWDSRVFWGDIITQSLDFAMMNRRYIVDEELSDRMSRYIIAFSYASMALLRGTSLGEEGGQGQALVDRGILTKEELDHMHKHPCWQPQWILDVIRAIVVEAHKVPNGKGIVVDESNKIHGQFVRCFDNGIKKLNDMIGDCVRTRASGLPASYDAITMTSFFTFFILAAFVWSASIGWMTPFIIAPAAIVIMLLIVMGSKLVDPFGLDKVDIPMEAFCATVEAQVNAIDERAKDGTILKFATGGVGKVKKSGKKLTSTVTIPKLN